MAVLRQDFVMTKSDRGGRARAIEVPRCRNCRRVMAERSGPGRPKEFCSQACRQWDWVGRQRARELQISEDELIVARAELDALYDELYVLSCAVADTEKELADRRATVTSLREAMGWLLEAAEPLRGRVVQR
jgi:hypothetical protein